MMRSSLENTSLHKKYWSDALLHSVFVKNRLPHFAFKFKSTLYTALTGVKPNLSNLKIFDPELRLENQAWVTARSIKQPAMRSLTKHIIPNNPNLEEL